MHPGKKAAGEYAASMVRSGMKVGLGTGSTAYHTVKKLGEMVSKGLEIIGYPTSQSTEDLAKAEGIPLGALRDVAQLDIVIDGADEFDPQLNLVKGGGGALFREKVVASLADTFIVVVDESKQVQQLGQFSLPIEVVPFAWQVTQRRIEALGVETTRRVNEGNVFLTDNQNYIIDAHFGVIENAYQLHEHLIHIVGVVETGLFLDMASQVVIGKNTG